jgi:SAM-dependent methyltransferase
MNPQEEQDAEYWFPYHYVSQFEGGFTQLFYDDWGIHYVSTIELMLAQLAEKPWQRVVDIGCGDGRLTREIARRFAGRVVHGVDYSPRAIHLAKAMNADLGEKIHFRAGDICVAADEPAYDVAILMEVLEHIPLESVPAFVAAVARMIAPGGMLLLTVPHRNKPVEYKHFQHFDAASLRAVLERDFVIQEIQPFERRGLRLKVLRFLLGNRYFLLAHRGLRNLLYRYYKASLFECGDEGECQRLFLRATPR